MRGHYTKREWAFLQLVEGSGGFFSRGQYDVFADVTAGGSSGRLVVKGLALRHLRRRDTGKKDRVYQWLGLEGELDRQASSSMIIRSLIALDFVLHHYTEYQFWLTDTAKTTFVTGLGELPAPLEIQWGCDPLFTPDGVTAGFCCVDHGRAFGTWLTERLAIITALPVVRIVYLGGNKTRAAAASAVVSRLQELLGDTEKIIRYEGYQSRRKASGLAGFNRNELQDYRLLTADFRGITLRSSGNIAGNKLSFGAYESAQAITYTNYFQPPLPGTLRALRSRLKAQAVKATEQEFVVPEIVPEYCNK